MASLKAFQRTLYARPALATATCLSVASAAYYMAKPEPIRLDSAANPPTPALSFPKTMLFSQQLKVTHVEQVNHDTKKITFELPGGKSQVSGVVPGGAILTQHTPQGAWFPVLRPYTPINDLSAPGILQLLVKKYPSGRASGHMHSLTPGSTLTVRGPIPPYTYTPSTSKERDVVLIAGGAGITPIYSLAKGILSDSGDKTRIQLLWGVNGARDIVLKEELETLQREHPERLRITYAVSGPEAAPGAPSLGSEEMYRKGYVNRALLEEAFGKVDKGAWGDEKGTKVFLCGPPKMEDALAGKQGVLGELGLGKKEIHRF